VTGLGQPGAGPDTCRFATGAGAVVQERPHGLPCRRVQHGLNAEGPMRPPRHTRQAPRVTRVDDVPPLVRGTVPGGGDRRGSLARSARSHNLAAAHAAGIVTAPPSFKGGALFVGEMANRERWFHRTAHLIQNTMYPNTLLKMY
jgi:hypothetical protein